MKLRNRYDSSMFRLVSAMDLADDIRAQKEICSAKQTEWDDNLAPSNSKENTDEVIIDMDRRMHVSNYITL